MPISNETLRHLLGVAQRIDASTDVVAAARAFRAYLERLARPELLEVATIITCTDGGTPADLRRDFGSWRSEDLILMIMSKPGIAARLSMGLDVAGYGEAKR